VWAFTESDIGFQFLSGVKRAMSGPEATSLVLGPFKGQSVLMQLLQMKDGIAAQQLLRDPTGKADVSA
jgi:hypothetical protein